MNLERARNLSILVLTLTIAGSEAAAQPAGEIALDPAIECWPHAEFPMLGALVTPSEEIVRSRLYFRCSLYPDYYFVDLKDEAGTYRGAAPQAEEACPEVHYYVEALSRDFASVRTEERIAEVAGPEECRRRFPGTAWFPGDDPGIFLGSLGTTGMAPGFKTIGIAGFISSTGGTVALGASAGGLSTGAIAGIAAAGGAAAGLGVLAAGGESSTTTAPAFAGPPPISTTTAPATTSVPPSPSGVVACFTLDPASGVVEENESMKVDGRCSQGEGLTYHYDLGDGRTRDGQPFITVTWPAAGTYTLKLTVTRNAFQARGGQSLEESSVSREIRVVEPAPLPSLVSADFTARNAGLDAPCVGEFDGSPSTGDIVRYQWELDLDNDFGLGVVRAEGKVVVHDWKAECFRAEGYLRARLTVVGRDGARDSIVKRVNILGFNPALPQQALVATAFASEIEPGREAEGQVWIEGGSGFRVLGGSPSRLSLRSAPGPVSFEAVATLATEPFLWRFDFRGAAGFVPGSLRVVSGQEVARDSHSLVLRFTGAPHERARVELRLSP